MAQDERARVVCIDPHDPELVARIEGQTRDLEIALRWLDQPLGAEPTAAELAQLAHDQTAQFVVVVQPNATAGLDVYVYAAAQHALRTRQVPRPVGAARLAASTVAETAALIVRGELSAVLSGEATIPNPPETPAGPSAEAASQSQSPAAVSSTQSPAQAASLEPAAHGGTGIVLAAGLRASLAAAHHALGGPWLSVSLALSSVELGLAASTTLPNQLHDASVRVALRRHALGIEALARLALAARVELGAGVAIGLAFYPRQTRLGTGSGLRETAASTSWTPTFGPVVGLRWRFVARGGLALRLGLDVNSRPTHFVYDDVSMTSGSVELAKLNVLEPWGLAALFVDLGP